MQMKMDKISEVSSAASRKLIAAVMTISQQTKVLKTEMKVLSFRATRLMFGQSE